jgi:predicted metal-dependent peptidase
MIPKRDPTEVKIKAARINLLFHQPFFGNLIMFLPLVDATDFGWCQTAAVDGRNIYYNRNFFSALQREEIEFVLCHEVFHVALSHFGRRSHRDPEWWNMANDYVINAMLMDLKIGKMPTMAVPVEVTNKNGKKSNEQHVGLYDEKYTKPAIWTSEAVYQDLEKNKAKKKMTLDLHIDMGDGSAKENARNGIPISVSAEDLKAIQEELKGKILRAASAAAGKMPASLKRLIDDLVEPKINWRDLLQQSIQSCIKDDFTWQRPNRKHMYSGIFLPTIKTSETIDLEIAIDMSGSITDEMGKDFLSEIHGIMNSYADFRIGVLSFDTQAYNHQVFTKDTIGDFMRYELKGGGGTDFECFWNHWKENGLEPKMAVVFTDGFPFGTWGPSKYCDTLWIITEGAKTKVKPPFGNFAYYQSKIGLEEVGSA